jgi:hypothetical protein
LGGINGGFAVYRRVIVVALRYKAGNERLLTRGLLISVLGAYQLLLVAV